MTYRFIVTRALIVGLIVGVLLGAYMVFVVEPVMDQAVALEEQMATAEEGDAGHSDDEGEAIFTRTEQKVGGVAAMVIYALIAAVLFGTVYAAVRHRIFARTDFGRVTRLAGLGFVAIALLPGIKYPATPPGVGASETVDQRTLLYLVSILIGILLAAATTTLSNRLRDQVSDPARVVLVTTVWVVGGGLALLLLPSTPDGIDPAVPAQLVWDFRIRSMGGLILLWAGLGLGLGWMLERPGRPAGSIDTAAAI